MNGTMENLEAENGRLAAELAAARELLVDLEWSRSDRYENERCPICAGKEPEHYEGCRLKSALDGIGEAKPSAIPYSVEGLLHKNELLRAVAEETIKFQAELKNRAPAGCGANCNVIHSTYGLMCAQRRAVEGGAMGDEDVAIAG